MTNFITQEGRLEIGPFMTIGVAGHCTLLLSDHRIMIMGGSYGVALSSVYVQLTLIYDFVAKTWTQGPQMILGRTQHACGLLKSQDQNKTIVIGLGGKCNNDFSVECLHQDLDCSLEHLDLDDGSYFQCGSAFPSIKHQFHYAEGIKEN